MTIWLSYLDVTITTPYYSQAKTPHHSWWWVRRTTCKLGIIRSHNTLLIGKVKLMSWGNDEAKKFSQGGSVKYIFVYFLDLLQNVKEINGKFWKVGPPLAPPRPAWGMLAQAFTYGYYNWEIYPILMSHRILYPYTHKRASISL